MKMKKFCLIFVMLCMLLMLLFAFAYAAELSCSYTYTGKQLAVTGSQAKAGSVVSVYVLEAPEQAGAVSDAQRPVIMEAVEADNDGEFSLSINLPKTLSSGRYKVNVASGADSWESTVFNHIDVSKLNITAGGGAIQAEMPYVGDTKTMILIGIYDEEGRLLRNFSDNSEDETLTVTASADGGSRYKVFIWNGLDSLQPCCGEIRGHVIPAA